jgi:hypothetical protein
MQSSVTVAPERRWVPPRQPAGAAVTAERTSPGSSGHRPQGREPSQDDRRRISLFLVPEDGLHPSLQGFRQRSASFGIVEIPNIPKVSKVKWNIVIALRN